MSGYSGMPAQRTAWRLGEQPTGLGAGAGHPAKAPGRPARRQAGKRFLLPAIFTAMFGVVMAGASESPGLPTIVAKPHRQLRDVMGFSSGPARTGVSMWHGLLQASAKK